MADEAKRIILNMLSEGKITVEESEKLLGAVNKKSEKETSADSDSAGKSNSTDRTNKRWIRPEKNKRDSEKSDYSRRIEDDEEDTDQTWGRGGGRGQRGRGAGRSGGGFIDPFMRVTKAGFDLRDVAQKVQETIEEAVQKTAPRQKEIKDRVKELGSWMQEVVEKTAADLAQNIEGTNEEGHKEVNFLIMEPENLENCRRVVIENPYGDVRVTKDKVFKIRVLGYIDGDIIEDERVSDWFKEEAVRLEHDILRIGFSPDSNLDAGLSFDVYLPEDYELECETVSTNIKVKGPFDLVSAKAVSGNIRLSNCTLKASCVDTVSGNVQLEDCNIATNMRSTSGDFLIKSSVVEGMNITTVSGDLMLVESTIRENGEIIFATTSGDVIVERIEGPWSTVEATSRSGDITLDWDGDLKDISNGSILRSNEPGCEFKVETVSGDIQFN